MTGWLWVQSLDEWWENVSLSVNIGIISLAVMVYVAMLTRSKLCGAGQVITAIASKAQP